MCECARVFSSYKFVCKFFSRSRSLVAVRAASVGVNFVKSVLTRALALAVSLTLRVNIFFARFAKLFACLRRQSHVCVSEIVCALYGSAHVCVCVCVCACVATVADTFDCVHFCSCRRHRCCCCCGCGCCRRYRRRRRRRRRRCSFRYDLRL